MCVLGQQGLGQVFVHYAHSSTMLSEIASHKRTNSEQFHLYEAPRVVKCRQTAIKRVVSRGLEGGGLGG